MNCPVSLSLGAYALGSLAGHERELVAAHLPDCAQCRDELAGMAGVVGLLHRLSTPVETLPDAPPPAAAEPVASRHAAGTAARRSSRVMVAVAAAVVVLGVTGVLTGLMRGGDSSPTRDLAASATWSTRDDASGVAATARLQPQQWGTSVRLRLTHLPSRLECRLVVTRVNGSGQTIGSWRSGYHGSVTVPASTALSPRDIATLDVVTGAGDRLVRLTPSSKSPAATDRPATT
jgi:anti-sigma factor RsiW